MLDKVEFLKKGFLLRKYRQYMWYFPSDKQMHWAGDSLRWGQIEKIWFLGNICLKDLAAGVQAQQQMKGIKIIFCQHSNNIDKLLERVRTYERNQATLDTWKSWVHTIHCLVFVTTKHRKVHLQRLEIECYGAVRIKSDKEWCTLCNSVGVDWFSTYKLWHK